MVKLDIAAPIVLISTTKRDIAQPVTIVRILLALSHVKIIHILRLLFLILTQQHALAVQDTPANSAKIKKQDSKVTVVQNVTILKRLIAKYGIATINAKFVLQFSLKLLVIITLLFNLLLSVSINYLVVIVTMLDVPNAVISPIILV